MMAWETAAYYTFSTVAQTLAGALGLLGAFVIIRTTALGQLLRADAEDLYRNVGHVGGRNQEAPAFFGCDWPQLIRLYREAHESAKGKQGGWEGLNERHLAVLVHGEQTLVARKTLLNRVAKALAASVGVMGLALLGLPTTPWLASQPSVAPVVLGLLAALAVGCLVWYALIVVATLRE